MLWQPCEMEWPDAPTCERQGVILVRLDDGDILLTCVECAQVWAIDRAGLVLR